MINILRHRRLFDQNVTVTQPVEWNDCDVTLIRYVIIYE